MLCCPTSSAAGRLLRLGQKLRWCAGELDCVTTGHRLVLRIDQLPRRLEACELWVCRVVLSKLRRSLSNARQVWSSCHGYDFLGGDSDA